MEPASWRTRASRQSIVSKRQKMNNKFGGKKPTGTPSLAWSTVVVVASLLAGASVVHNIYKPDLVSCLPLQTHVRCSMKCLAEPNFVLSSLLSNADSVLSWREMIGYSVHF